MEGVNTVESKVIAAYDTRARSIGGEDKLNSILNVGAAVDNEISMEVKTPVQSLNIPLDIQVIIADAGNPEDAEVITIKSRPNYADTDIQPVMMATTDGKTVFWAPINVGATEMPTSVASTGDITKSCGRLFQWGRKSGVTTTTDQAVINRERYAEKVFPTGEDYLSSMVSWNGKHISQSDSFPNTRGNWLLINTDGSDNPEGKDMVTDAWYQKLWNSGTEENPVKTESDPCPEGWRVPTESEWKAIGIGNSSVTKNWDNANKIMTIAGAESGQKFVLPASGYRVISGQGSARQGSRIYFWSSSIDTDLSKAKYVALDNTADYMRGDPRSAGYPIRCIQE